MSKTIEIGLSEECIFHLKNARERILKTLDYEDGQYDAVEIFTLNSIIERYEEKSELLARNNAKDDFLKLSEHAVLREENRDSVKTERLSEN